MLVAGPSVVAVVGVVHRTAADRTGDPLVFLTTKSRWQEITFVGLFEGHVKWSVLPARRAGASARSVVLVVQRKQPAGVVAGVRRALPHPVVAARHGRRRPLRQRVLPAVRRRRPAARAVVDARARALYFAASTVGLVLFAVVAARYDLVP